MHGVLKATPFPGRLAAAFGAVVAALACAVALSTQAQAATVAWSSVTPPARYCHPTGGWAKITLRHGWADIRECLGVGRGVYYQGVLEVRYHSQSGEAGDVLGGKSMIVRVGNPKAIGVNDCRPELWTSSRTRYCYSPTKRLPAGHKFYGKGILTNSSGGWYQPPVWSPVKPDKPG